MAECTHNAYQTTDAYEVDADFPPHIDYEANYFGNDTCDDYAPEEVGRLDSCKQDGTGNITQQSYDILNMAVFTNVENPLAEVLRLAEEVKCNLWNGNGEHNHNQ